jgi:UDP-N-acetylmuramyl tripeptide synthase
MLRALRLMRGSADDNPGRANFLEVGGVKILLDYAHNPHGLSATLGLAVNLPGRRRLLVVLGQAGDRGDEALRELAGAAWAFRPDRIVVKELPEMLRGRPEGEIPAILEGELRRLGATDGDLGRARNEMEAVRQALAWARPGDLLVLLTHAQRDEVLELLGRLSDTGWQAGQPVGR